MANRRMFSNRIANSAKFLTMPAESQSLYFHLVLRADDDGVVESYPVLRLLGYATDNFQILVAKGFIQELNDDQVVVILDWLEHNKIRSDRKVDSIYRHLLPEDVKVIEPRPRSDVKDNTNRIKKKDTDSPLSVHGQHKLGQVKSGKDRLSQDRLGEVSMTPAQEAREFFSGGDIVEQVITKFEGRGMDREAITLEAKKFILYWTELNKTGKKQRWEMEKTFEVKRRLATWLSRSQKFSSGGIDKKSKTITI